MPSDKTSARTRRNPRSSTARGRTPSRTSPGGRPGKFSAPPSPRGLPGRRKPAEQKSGVKGALSGALSSLPIGGDAKSKGRKSSAKGGLMGKGSSKGKSSLMGKSSSKGKGGVKGKGAPALAVLAAGAGAVLGGKQLAKRKGGDNEVISETPVAPVTDATPAASAP